MQRGQRKDTAKMIVQQRHGLLKAKAPFSQIANVFVGKAFLAIYLCPLLLYSLSRKIKTINTINT
jgi:hypothetical protein